MAIVLGIEQKPKDLYNIKSYNILYENNKIYSSNKEEWDKFGY